MYIDSWDDFAQRARQMYLASPMNTRYVLRYNHEKGKLVAKVSDDRKCWQFKTEMQADAKKMHELTQFFIELMSGARDEDDEDEVLHVQSQPVAHKKGKRRG